MHWNAQGNHENLKICQQVKLIWKKFNTKGSYETTQCGAAGSWCYGMNLKVTVNLAFLVIESHTNPGVPRPNRACLPGMGIQPNHTVAKLSLQLTGKMFRETPANYVW